MSPKAVCSVVSKYCRFTRYPKILRQTKDFLALIIFDNTITKNVFQLEYKLTMSIAFLRFSRFIAPVVGNVFCKPRVKISSV